jgi:hypothetical protein
LSGCPSAISEAVSLPPMSGVRSVVISIGITTTVALLPMCAYTLTTLVWCDTVLAGLFAGRRSEPVFQHLAQAGLERAVAGGARRREHVDVLRGTRG